MRRQRQHLPMYFRYPDPDRPRNRRESLIKPAADISGWMRRENFDKDKLLEEGELLREWVMETGRTDPNYAFILDEILDGKPPPPAFRSNGTFIKKEERRVSYFQYRVHREAFELMLWELLRADFPRETRRYYRGFPPKPDIKLDEIQPDQLYWIKVEEYIVPVTFTHWDDEKAAWIGRAEDTNHEIALKSTDRLRPPFPSSSGKVPPSLD